MSDFLQILKGCKRIRPYANRYFYAFTMRVDALWMRDPLLALLADSKVATGLHLGILACGLCKRSLYHLCALVGDLAFVTLCHSLTSLRHSRFL